MRVAKRRHETITNPVSAMRNARTRTLRAKNIGRIRVTTARAGE
jgi:hypothetical protein